MLAPHVASGPSVVVVELTIGEVAARTGVTERTLRYYEELGLLAPARDDGGRRRYSHAVLDRLYRIRLLRRLGTRLGDLDPDAADLRSLTRRHLAELDARLAELARQRERVRAVEDRLLDGTAPSDEALLDLLSGLGGDEATPTRRITLLAYRDLAAAHSWLVEVFGLAPGPVSRHDGQVVHAEVFAGDGVIWLHREAPEHRLVPPLALNGFCTAALAVHVDDVDAHHARAVAAGAVITQPPTDQAYGYREYSVLDPEGHLWSFQTPLPEPHHPEEDR